MFKSGKIKWLFTFCFSRSGRNELATRLPNYFWTELYWLATLFRKYFRSRVKIVVVAGSVGKTTTTANIKKLLGHSMRATYQSNSFSAVALQILALKRKSKLKVIEVGIARRGDMEKYAKMIRPDVVVITAITSDHIEHLGSFDEIWKEKAKILHGPKAPELIVYNGDDEYVKMMVAGSEVKKVSYGFHPGNVYRCSYFKINWPLGYDIKIAANGSEISTLIPLFGEKMMYTYLAAYAIAMEFNIPKETVLSQTIKIKPVNGRMQLIELKNGAWLIRDDFKSSPETVFAAFDFLNSIPEGRKIIVQGGISHVAKNQRKMFQNAGAKAGETADFVFAISSKVYEQTFNAHAKKAGLNAKKVFKHKGNWEEAAAKINEILQPGDVILVKGTRLQKFERLSLLLMGERVTCRLKDCRYKFVFCKDCSQL